MNLPSSISLYAAPRHRSGATGFTLIEVVMASFILVLAITTSITTLQRGFAELDTARNVETACRILQCEMEKERLLSWAEVTDTSQQPVLDACFQSIPTIAGRFTLSRTVSTVANHSGNMVQVSLTATWKNYDGRSQNRKITSYFGNGGLYKYFSNQP